MATQWLKNLSHKAAHMKLLGPVYNASLGKPDGLLNFESFPPDLFGGDAGRGRWIANGQIDINGYRISLDFDQWFVGSTEQSTPYFKKLHAFDFLLELKALGGDAGRQAARDITQKWLNDFDSFDPITWDENLVASRLVNWLLVYPYAYESASDEFLNQLHGAFYRQYRHLEQSFQSQKDWDQKTRFITLWALLITQCHCSNFYDDLIFQTYLQLIKGALEEVILPDGGLENHNLNEVADVLMRLIMLRQSLQTASKPVDLWLSKSIENLTKIVGNLCHTDGDVPLFQGAVIGDKKQTEKIIKQSALRMRRSNQCYADTGYTIMRHGRTSVIVDHVAKGSHTAPLAFEISHGGKRFISSCGHHVLDKNWAKGLSLTAAHSGLMIEGAEPDTPIKNITATLEGMNGASLFCGSHEGYAASHDGLIHTRRLYVDADGQDIRGEDLLTRNAALKPIPTIARFHLWPGISASMIEDHSAILLRLKNGVGWMFKPSMGQLDLEESIICHDGMQVQKTQQIALRVLMDDLSLQIKWALKRQ